MQAKRNENFGLLALQGQFWLNLGVPVVEMLSIELSKTRVHDWIMRVTLNLEKDLWEAAQAKAQAQNTTLDKAIVDLLRLGLKAEQSRPHFTFSLPGGPVTATDVKAALEDDDE